MSKFITTATGDWEVVIGLEVHAQVVSKSKLFSGAATSFAAEPNSKVSLIDAGMPGMLPTINKFCVEQAIKTGLGIHAEICEVSQFDRKNYFYADLPTGYQITQMFKPIVGPGHIDVELSDDTTKRVRIHHVHLEQDAGKSVHDLHPTKTCIDLNRAGTALMEIVTEPDMRSAEEAAGFLKKLRLILRYLGTSDGNMDEGSMRADVNVSVHRPGTPYGTRAEIKNVNSFRFVMQAIEYEINRQIMLLESGEQVVQETRLFDSVKGETRSMRGKEDAMDYRYFPDPDLLPVHVTQAQIDAIRKTLPELPDDKKQRFMAEYGLSSYDASVFVDEIETPAFYEAAVKASTILQKDPAQKMAVAKMVANWLMGDLFAALKRENLSIATSKVSPEDLAGLVDLILGDVISGRIAKDVFLEMWETGQPAQKIVDSKGLVQITDNSAIEAVITTVIGNNAPMVEQYKAGKDKVFGFFVGQVMKETGGKANPKLVNDLLIQKLKEI